MVAERQPATKVVIVNPAARSTGADDIRRLSTAFPECLLLTVGADEDFGRLLAGAAMTEDALVVAVGGDGTVEAVVRVLAGTRHPLGIVPRGTFNNFARALGIPLGFDEAVRAIQHGRPAPVTYGTANGKPFLEVVAVGTFGDALALGDALKDLRYDDAAGSLRDVVQLRPFRYRLSGDSERRGTARSLVVTNTRFTGANIAVGDASPDDPFLELLIWEGRRGRWRWLARALLRQPRLPVLWQKVRRLHVETSPRMRVYADAAEAGETPVEIEAVSGGLQVVR